MLHKRPNAVMDNYEMQHVGPAHLQRVPMKRDHQQNGKNQRMTWIIKK